MALQEEFEKRGNWLFRYRSNLPLLILLVGIGVYLITKLYPNVFQSYITPYEFYYELACLAVSLLGLIVRIYTVGHTPKNTSGRNVKEQLADTLNTTGIYSMVRHPLYVGNFLMWFGPALLTQSLWFNVAFCLFYWVYYERIMFAEEQFLRRKFGEVYLKWSENVPPFMPKFKNFKKSTLDFSWKKVIKKEKNGLFATFMIFFTFDYLGDFVVTKEAFNPANYNSIFMYGAAFTGVLYFILKFLKSNTKVFHETGR